MEHYCWEDIPLEQVNDGFQRRIITGERTMISQIFLDRGFVVPEHHHENEQITYIAEGALKFVIEGREVIVRAGEVLVIPSNVPHSAEALENTVDIDIFTPPRQDWLQGADTYLRTAPPAEETSGSRE